MCVCDTRKFTLVEGLSSHSCVIKYGSVRFKNEQFALESEVSGPPYPKAHSCAGRAWRDTNRDFPVTFSSSRRYKTEAHLTTSIIADCSTLASSRTLNMYKLVSTCGQYICVYLFIVYLTKLLLTTASKYLKIYTTKMWNKLSWLTLRSIREFAGRTEKKHEEPLSVYSICRPLSNTEQES